jgi:hypothetical protein
MVITGHVHAYERTFPVYRNVTVADATTYFVIGDGGNAEGHQTHYWPQPAWSAYRNGTQYGHASLSLMNKTHALWKVSGTLEIVSFARPWGAHPHSSSVRQWHRNVDGEAATRDSAYVCNSLYGNAICS